MNNDNIMERDIPKLERPTSLALIGDLPSSCMDLDEECIYEMYEENLRLKRECYEAQFLINSLTSQLVAAVQSDIFQHQRCQELVYEKNLHCAEAAALKTMFLNALKSSNDFIRVSLASFNFLFKESSMTTSRSFEDFNTIRPSEVNLEPLNMLLVPNDMDIFEHDLDQNVIRIRNRTDNTFNLSRCSLVSYLNGRQILRYRFSWFDDDCCFKPHSIINLWTNTSPNKKHLPPHDLIIGDLDTDQICQQVEQAKMNNEQVYLLDVLYNEHDKVSYSIYSQII